MPLHRQGACRLKSENGKSVKKGYLPEKPCVCCGKPMIWRKKWERDWENVKFCSERCRRQGASPIKTESTTQKNVVNQE